MREAGYFGARPFVLCASVQRMDVLHLAMGIGSLVAGASSLHRAFSKKRDSNLGKLELTGRMSNPNGQPSASIYRVHSIDERLAGVAVQTMRSIRDPRIRQLAASIVSRRDRKPNERTGDGGWAIDERDYWGEVKALFNWTRANVRYIRDIATIDTFALAWRTIEAHAGDCDDYQILLAALFMSIGYSVRMKTIQTTDSDDWNHIYLQVGLPPGKPTTWRTIDASVAQPAGWEAPRSMIKRFRLDYPDDPKWRKYFP